MQITSESKGLVELLQVECITNVQFQVKTQILTQTSVNHRQTPQQNQRQNRQNSNQIKNREKRRTRLASGSRHVWELCESDTAFGLTTTGALQPRRRTAAAGAGSLSPEKTEEAAEMARAGGRRKGVEAGAPRPGLEGEAAGDVDSLDTPTAAAAAAAMRAQLDSDDD